MVYCSTVFTIRSCFVMSLSANLKTVVKKTVVHTKEVDFLHRNIRMKKRREISMKWLVFLVVSAGIGTAAMTLFERAGVNVWISRGVGALAAAIAGIIVYKLLTKEK